MSLRYKYFGKKHIILFSILLWASLAHAQESIFSAALTGGFTASQLDGDGSAGFNKVGFSAGVIGITELKDNMELNIELLYTQAGSQSKVTETGEDIFKIHLNYLEIPVIFKLKDWLYGTNEDAYHKVQVHAGLSYAQFIDGNINELQDILLENFNDANVSWLLGGGYHINKNIAVIVRYTRGLGRAYDFDDIRLQSQALSFRAEYRF